MTLTALYSPDWHSRPNPDTIVMLFHGYGSNERDLPGIVEHLGIDAPLVSLRAPLDMGAGAAAWFPLDENLTIAAQPVEDATTIVWQWIDENVAPETRIITIGFSQGGLMASQLLRTRARHCPLSHSRTTVAPVATTRIRATVAAASSVLFQATFKISSRCSGGTPFSFLGPINRPTRSSPPSAPPSSGVAARPTP